MYPIGQVVITTASYIESIMGEAPVLSSVTQEKSLWDRITPHQVKHLAAGGIAGAVSRTSVSPFERLKILYQIQTENEVSRKRFKGIIPSLVKIWREEGFLGYYKGNGTNVLRIVPYMAVQFAAYEEYKKILRISDGVHNPVWRLCAGAMAGITSVTVTYPLDLVRTRLSAQGEGINRKYKNVRHCFQTILKEEGGFWRGCLYRGLSPTLMGIAPYVGLNFAVYETLKVHFLSHSQDTQLSVPLRLGCGAVAGATAQSITYPLDVVRRRTQMKGLLSEKFSYNSTRHAFTMIIKQEGIKGLYKGMIPNLLKVAPSIAIAFVTDRKSVV